MWDFKLLSATHSIERTMPFVVYRLLSYLAISLAFLIAILAGTGSAVGIESLSKNPFALANLGAVAGFSLCGWIVWKLRKTLHYAITGGHLALLAELSAGKPLPEGTAQIEHAKQVLSRKIRSPASLFDLDRCIAGVLFSITENRAVRALTAMQPALLRRGLSKLAGQVGSYTGRAVLGVALCSETNDPWRSAQAVLLACARQVEHWLKNALYLIAFEYLGWLGLFFLLLTPVHALAAALPFSVGLWPYLFAVLFAWSIKAAFLEPIAVAAMMQIYSRLAAAGAAAPAPEELPGDIAEKLKALEEAAKAHS